MANSGHLATPTSPFYTARPSDTDIAEIGHATGRAGACKGKNCKLHGTASSHRNLNSDLLTSWEFGDVWLRSES